MDSLLVQWLRVCAPNEEGPGSIPDQRTRSHIPQLRLNATAKSWHGEIKFFKVGVFVFKNSTAFIHSDSSTTCKAFTYTPEARLSRSVQCNL